MPVQGSKACQTVLPLHPWLHGWRHASPWTLYARTWWWMPDLDPECLTLATLMVKARPGCMGRPSGNAMHMERSLAYDMDWYDMIERTWNEEWYRDPMNMIDSSLDRRGYWHLLIANSCCYDLSDAGFMQAIKVESWFVHVLSYLPIICLNCSLSYDWVTLVKPQTAEKHTWFE